MIGRGILPAGLPRVAIQAGGGIPLPLLIGADGQGWVLLRLASWGGGAAFVSSCFDFVGVFPFTNSYKLNYPSESYFLHSTNQSPLNL